MESSAKVTSASVSGAAIAPQMRILVVDDEPSLRASCASILTHDGYEVSTCGRGEEARSILERQAFDVALIDLHMAGVTGMDLLKVCQQHHPRMFVIIMTGQPDVSTSVAAIHAGAWDYLPKPFTATHLQVLLGRAQHCIQAERSGMDASVPARPGRHTRRDDGNGHNGARHHEFLGESPAFLQLVRLAERVARTNASVFLTGESGAGKEMVAQFIHSKSRRSTKPMVAVNCAALPETLLESEMFGHVKGAFTGAVRDKPGLLEMADGGTLFLDELTEMSLPIQAKLLRVIQDGQVRRVGSETVDAKVNVRFIAATNRDAREATEEGTLRKDLFYRLSVVPLRVPSLRERVEDIPLLAEHFLRSYWTRHRDPSERLPTFSKATLSALVLREWRGNVRELQNAMEHAVVILEEGSEIEPTDIPYLEETLTPASPSSVADWSRNFGALGMDYHTARERIMAEFELLYIQEIMLRSGANMSKAARTAGVDRTTLYRLLQKHGLHRDTAITAS